MLRLNGPCSAVKAMGRVIQPEIKTRKKGLLAVLPASDCPACKAD